MELLLDRIIAWLWPDPTPLELEAMEVAEKFRRKERADKIIAEAKANPMAVIKKVDPKPEYPVIDAMDLICKQAEEMTGDPWGYEIEDIGGSIYLRIGRHRAWVGSAAEINDLIKDSPKEARRQQALRLESALKEIYHDWKRNKYYSTATYFCDTHDNSPVYVPANDFRRLNAKQEGASDSYRDLDSSVDAKLLRSGAN